jgi:hypothetical protein
MTGRPFSLVLNIALDPIVYENAPIFPKENKKKLWLGFEQIILCLRIVAHLHILQNVY